MLPLPSLSRCLLLTAARDVYSTASIVRTVHGSNSNSGVDNATPQPCTHIRLELEDAKRDMFPFRASHSWFLLQDRQTETAQREAASLVQLVYRRREKPAGRRGRRACLALAAER